MICPKCRRELKIHRVSDDVSEAVAIEASCSGWNGCGLTIFADSDRGLQSAWETKAAELQAQRSDLLQAHQDMLDLNAGYRGVKDRLTDDLKEEPMTNETEIRRPYGAANTARLRAGVARIYPGVDYWEALKMAEEGGKLGELAEAIGASRSWAPRVRRDLQKQAEGTYRKPGFPPGHNQHTRSHKLGAANRAAVERVTGKSFIDAVQEADRIKGGLLALARQAGIAEPIRWVGNIRIRFRKQGLLPPFVKTPDRSQSLDHSITNSLGGSLPPKADSAPPRETVTLGDSPSSESLPPNPQLPTPNPSFSPSHDTRCSLPTTGGEAANSSPLPPPCSPVQAPGAPTLEGLVSYIHSLPCSELFRLPHQTGASVQSLYYALQRDLSEEVKTLA